MPFFSSIPNFLGSWALNSPLPFHPHGKDPLSSIDLSYTSLGRGMMLAKFLLPTPVCPNQHFLFLLFSSFLLQQNAETSPLETWTSTKAFSSMGNCPSQNFPSATSKRGESWFTSSCHFHSPYRSLSVYCPMHRWVGLLPDILACGAAFHSTHRNTFVDGQLPNCRC